MFSKVFAVSSVVLLLVLAVAVANASACSGKSYTWSGEGDGHSWSDEENWKPEGVPSAEDSATITGTVLEEAEVEGGSQICDLTVKGPDAFLTNTNMAVSGDLTWEGGQGMEPSSELEGTFTVDGSTTLAHKLGLSGTIKSYGSLEVEGGTELTMGGGGDELIAETSASIGGGLGGVLGQSTVIQSNGASEGNANAKLHVNGALTLGGEVESSQLDLEIGPEGSVDLDGNTWSLPGLSFSRWKGGAEVKSSKAGGTIAFSNLAQLLVDGSVTVGKNTLVSMRGDSTLTDGRHAFSGEPSGSVGLLRGEGILEWQSGSFEGQVTLAPSFHTVLDTTAKHGVIAEAGTLLRNEGEIDEQSGELLVDGEPAEIENQSKFKVHAGAEMNCNSSACFDGFDNTASGTLEIVAPEPQNASAFLVPMHQLGMVNGGDIKVGENQILQVNGDGKINFADGAALSGGGVLELGQEGKANVTGTTTLSEGVAFNINGNEAELHGGVVNLDGDLFPGVLTAAHAGEGTLDWLAGSIGGSLLLDNQLRTVALGESSATRAVVEDETDSHNPSRDPTLITMAGPSQIDRLVHIDSAQNKGTAIRVTGQMQINGNEGGFEQGSSKSDGISVDSPGAVNVVGKVEIEAPLQVLGTLSLANPAATLTVPGGYTQEGPNAKTVLSGGTISTNNGDETFQTIPLKGGSLTGPGKLEGSLEVSGATVSPSEGSPTGTLSVEGDYEQQLGGTLAIHLGGIGASEHDTLAVSEEAKLAGNLDAITDAGYVPSVPTTVTNALTSEKRTGLFSAVSSSGAPAHTVWSALYNNTNGVDLLLESTGSGNEGGGIVNNETPSPGTNSGSTTSKTPPSDKPSPEPAPDLKPGQAGVTLGSVKILSHGKMEIVVHNSHNFSVQLQELKLIASVPTSKHGTHKVVLLVASPHVSVAARHTDKIVLRLSRAGLAALRSHHDLKATFQLLVKAPDGSKAMSTGALKLDS